MSPFLTEIRPAPSALWDLWADAGRPRRLTTNLAGPTAGVCSKTYRCPPPQRGTDELAPRAVMRAQDF